MSNFKANINPEVLRWAREEAGLSELELSTKLKVKQEKYLSWEKSGKEVPFGVLKKIASYCKRQVATFFLPEKPESTIKPKDYRNLANNSVSTKVALVLRRANRFRQKALELEGESYWSEKYEWEKEAKELVGNKGLNDENLIQLLRGKLDVSLDEQISFKNPHESYKKFRNAVENELGILVFQFSMPLDEVQGFCYLDYKPYCIVVNSQHPPNARIFTIFHELGHILDQHSGICLPHNDTSEQGKEFMCNSFAANFLVPDKILVATTSLSEMTLYANKLKVSREVYLRKLYDSNLITRPKFFSLLNQIKKSYKTKSSSGFVLPEVRSLAERGETFYNLILDSTNKNKMNFTEAKDMLGLSTSLTLNELGK